MKSLPARIWRLLCWCVCGAMSSPRLLCSILQTRAPDSGLWTISKNNKQRFRRQRRPHCAIRRGKGSAESSYKWRLPRGILTTSSHRHKFLVHLSTLSSRLLKCFWGKEWPRTCCDWPKPTQWAKAYRNDRLQCWVCLHLVLSLYIIYYLKLFELSASLTVSRMAAVNCRLETKWGFSRRPQLSSEFTLPRSARETPPPSKLATRLFQPRMPRGRLKSVHAKRIAKKSLSVWDPLSPPAFQQTLHCTTDTAKLAKDELHTRVELRGNKLPGIRPWVEMWNLLKILSIQKLKVLDGVLDLFSRSPQALC